jgi:hypothetical protein
LQSAIMEDARIAYDAAIEALRLREYPMLEGK